MAFSCTEVALTDVESRQEAIQLGHGDMMWGQLLMDVARLGMEGFAAKEAFFLLALNLALNLFWLSHWIFCYYTSFNIDAQDMKKQLIDHWVGMHPASSDGFV